MAGQADAAGRLAVPRCEPDAPFEGFLMWMYGRFVSSSYPKDEQYKLIRMCTFVLIYAETCVNPRKIIIDPKSVKLIFLDP
jgi:hypothetical protein